MQSAARKSTEHADKIDLCEETPAHCAEATWHSLTQTKRSPLSGHDKNIPFPRQGPRHCTLHGEYDCGSPCVPQVVYACLAAANEMHNTGY